MKKLILLLIATFTLANCAEKTSKKEVESNSKTSTILDTTLVAPNGEQLKLQFNNSNQTLQITFNNEIIELQRDRTGSGTQYSNNNYQYNNWHGITILKKDGNLIFEDKPSNK